MRTLFSLLAMVLLAACVTTGGGGAVNEIHLFGMPVVANLDSKPGADGFAVRVYITKSGNAKGASVRQGVVEILMFDGVAGGADLSAAAPTQTWKFSASELSRFEEITSLGHGYKFALPWTNPPKSQHITVVARYLPVKGEPLYSAPSAISTVVK